MYILLPNFHFTIDFISLLGPNQVQSFLTEHGEPGVQHIGLHTEKMLSVVSTLKQRGVRFIIPPKTYYSEVSDGNVVFVDHPSCFRLKYLQLAIVF